MGSFQVGVLKAFVDNLPARDIKWDVITGVSVGSINAAAIAFHEIGKEKDAIKWMLGLWERLSKPGVYKNWPVGVSQGLFMKEGLWDNTPLHDFLQKEFDIFTAKKLKRRVNFNT